MNRGIKIKIRIGRSRRYKRFINKGYFLGQVRSTNFEKTRFQGVDRPEGSEKSLFEGIR